MVMETVTMTAATMTMKSKAQWRRRQQLGESAALAEARFCQWQRGGG
jgi:hypothetical protein